MPQHPKPFFRPSRNLWYVQFRGKQINLGPDRDQAFQKYHELMRASPKAVSSDLVVAVIDAFLDWVKENRASRSYEWYRRHLQNFVSGIPNKLTVGQFKPFHLTQVLASHSTWGPTTKNGLCRAVQRSFRWAERQGLVEKSPVAYFEKPRAKTRQVAITEAEYQVILGNVCNSDFGDLLVATWETGARPQEIVRVEARHVDLTNNRWVFPAEESKGKRTPRIVYLTERALEITRRRMIKHPNGPLFRNSVGNAWDRYALHCAFERLQVKMGLEKIKELKFELPSLPRFKPSAVKDKNELGKARLNHSVMLRKRRKEIRNLAKTHSKRYVLTHFRHSWATRALQRGVDPLATAILMGHSDPSMLAKVYQHLAQDPEYLHKALKKASGT